MSSIIKEFFTNLRFINYTQETIQDILVFLLYNKIENIFYLYYKYIMFIFNLKLYTRLDNSYIICFLRLWF